MASTPPVTDRYQMFAPGDCNQPLPLNRITDVFRFSQFVTIARQVDAIDVKVVLPPPPDIYERARGVAHGNPESTMIDLLGGIPLGAKLGEQPWTAPLASAVEVANVDALLSNRTIELEQGKYSVQLDPPAIRQLLAGQDAVVTAVKDSKDKKQTRLLRLTQKRADLRPASLDISIRDLPAFLARPRVVSQEGADLPLALSAADVTALRRDGRATLRVGEVNVNVSVSPAPALQVATYAATIGQIPIESAGNSIRQGAGDLSYIGPSTRGVTLPTNFDLVLNLQWLQTWELLGYSRGRLLNTVSLAPQEETTVEIFTWDRRTASSEMSSSVESEESLERSDTVRDTTDVMRQAQSNSEFGFNAGATIGINYEQIINIRESIDASQKSSFGGLAKTTTNFVHEAVVKSANRVKLSRQTKVNESRESGREERVTRKVRNPNMCHTLNLDYFEVLANYAIKTAFAPAESGLCVLVDNPVTVHFDRWALRVYEQSLSRFLLDRKLEGGFAAARMLEAREQACGVLCSQCYCDGPGGEPAADAVRELQQLMTSIGSVVTLLNNSSVYMDVWFELLQLFDDAGMRNPVYLEPAQWWVFTQLMRISHGPLMRALTQISNQTRSQQPVTDDQLDRLRFELDAVGGVAGLNPDRLYQEHSDDMMYAIVVQYSQFLQANPQYPNLNWWDRPANPFPAFFTNSDLFDSIDDKGLLFLLSRFTALHDAVKKSRQNQGAAATLKLQEDSARGDVILSAFGLREVTEAIERESALLAHLNLYGSYYRAMLWNALPPTAQLQFLRSLLPYGIVDPHSVGFLGNRLAFPVRLDVSAEARALVEALIAQNAEVQNVERVENVALPTPAVTVESRLGMCDGCEEFIERSRELELKAKDLQNQLAEQEVARYTARLAQNTPLLDDPDPKVASLRIVLETPDSPRT